MLVIRLHKFTKCGPFLFDMTNQGLFTSNLSESAKLTEKNSIWQFNVFALYINGEFTFYRMSLLDFE